MSTYVEDTKLYPVQCPLSICIYNFNQLLYFSYRSCLRPLGQSVRLLFQCYLFANRSYF